MQRNGLGSRGGPGVLAPIAMAVAMAAGAAGGPTWADAPPREIVVTGEGRVEAAPDMAVVESGVEIEAETAEDAMAGMAATMAQVLAAAAAAGIAERDLQTTQLALSPVYRPRDDGAWSPEVTGYSASSTVRLRVRDLEALGPVLDAVTAAGANRLSGIGFALAEPRDALDRARRDAVEDARAKAALLAEAAGVQIGAVAGLRETQAFDRPFPMRAQADMGLESAVAQGVVAMEAMVEMVFTIAD